MISCGERGLAPDREERTEGGLANARVLDRWSMKTLDSPVRVGSQACETQHAAHGGSRPLPFLYEPVRPVSHHFHIDWYDDYDLRHCQL